MRVVKTELDLLGRRVRDRVTGFQGVVTSVTFDLYGGIQALVHPGTDKENKFMDQCWLDTNRLVVTNNDPVMVQPEFCFGVADHISFIAPGTEEKPRYTKS